MHQEPSPSLDGCVVAITGAGHGLGRSHALACAAEGASVVINDLDEVAAAEVVAELRAGGAEAAAAVGRVDVAAVADRIVATAVETWGRLDAVVNNAGLLRDRTLARMSESEWDEVLDVHLRGAFLVTRAAWPQLRASGSGRVVMTTSHAGLVGNHGQANYAAAKMGLVGMANVLAIEGAPHGIRVNTVAPLARTRQSEGVWPEAVLERLDPAHVSAVVAFLCSPACRDSGTVIGVAGATYVRHLLCDAGRLHVDAPPDVAELSAQWDQLMRLDPATSPTTVASVESMLGGGAPDDGG